MKALRGILALAALLCCGNAFVVSTALAQSVAGKPRTGGRELLIHNSVYDFSLELPAAFGAVAARAGSKSLYSFSAPATTASLTQFYSPNRNAFQRRRSAEFFSQIERGLAQRQAGYKALHSRAQRIEGVPILDLEFLRTAPSQTQGPHTKQRVFMRMMFRYRYTLVATASVASKASRSRKRDARRFSQSLRPTKR